MRGCEDQRKGKGNGIAGEKTVKRKESKVKRGRKRKVK
jgi:hypothetical protein